MTLASRRVVTARHGFSAPAALAALYGGGGASLLLAALFPMSEHASTGLGVGIGVFALAVATVLLAAGSRLRASAPAVLLAVATCCLGVLIWKCTTTAGLMVTAFDYPCIGLYAAYFFPRRLARLQVAWAVVSFAVAAVASAASDLAVAVPVVVAALVLTSEVLGGLVEELRRRADTDALTGLLNRSAFVPAAELEIARTARRDGTLTVAVVDLDDFKQTNDLYGHSAGDALLAGLAAAWRAALPPEVLLARYGGDEFTLLLPDTDTAGAAAVMTRLRSAYPARWSVGTTEWRAGDDLDALFRRADADLYRAKAAARTPRPRRPLGPELVSGDTGRHRPAPRVTRRPEAALDA